MDLKCAKCGVSLSGGLNTYGYPNPLCFQCHFHPERSLGFADVFDLILPNKLSEQKPQHSTENNLSDTDLSTQDNSATLEGVIYLIKAGQFYKIGKTTKPKARYSQLKIQLPHATELIHEIKTNNINWLEKHWHKRFHYLRANGEWFALSPSDVSEVMACDSVEISVKELPAGIVDKDGLPIDIRAQKRKKKKKQS